VAGYRQSMRQRITFTLLVLADVLAVLVFGSLLISM